MQRRHPSPVEHSVWAPVCPLAVPVFGLCLAALSGCGDNRALLDVPALPAATPTVESEAPEDPPDLTPPPQALALARVVPDHGPFVGGRSVLLRGAGFAAGAQVFFGSRQLEPEDLFLEDTRRLGGVSPASEPGPVDVRVRVDGEEVLLEAGYTYDPIVLDPEMGSVSGGTRVRVQAFGELFEPGDVLRFGDRPCTTTEILSSNEALCVTVAQDPRVVDVQLERDGDVVLTVSHAFTYADTSDGLGGGLSGGAIDGVINVTVIDDLSGLPVPDAFVALGDPGGDLVGRTDAQFGQVAFSAPDLRGPSTVTVSKRCYENGSIVDFDARDVTVFLRPWDCLACLGLDYPNGIPLDELRECQGPIGGSGRLVSSVGGDLLFPSSQEFGPSPWDIMPPATEETERVAYVFTTQRRPDRANPSTQSGVADAVVRVVEDGAVAGPGYPYRIASRPAGLAVYAIAGLERRDDARFVPYVMGVRRGVLVGPGERVQDVDIVMDMLLEQRLEVNVSEVPSGGAEPPDQWTADLHLDLGAEGVIVRRVNGEELDRRRALSDSRRFDFGALPALEGPLQGARLGLEIRWATGPFATEPRLFGRVGDIRQYGQVDVGGFVGIASPTSPVDGGVVAADRTLRWVVDGAPADFQVISLVGSDGNPAWRLVLPGDARQAPLPDFSIIDGLLDLASGSFRWSISAGKKPGFSFENFSYPDLRTSRWTYGASRSMVAIQ